MSDTYSAGLPSQSENVPKRELQDLEPASDDPQHDSVKGGKGTPILSDAAVKGQVFKKVEIHGTA